MHLPANKPVLDAQLLGALGGVYAAKIHARSEAFDRYQVLIDKSSTIPVFGMFMQYFNGHKPPISIYGATLHSMTTEMLIPLTRFCDTTTLTL